MHKFTHVDAFYQVIRYVESLNADPECPERYKIRSPVSYRGTVKLHGSNAGVCCTLAGLTAQSRSRAITPEDDNYGFAQFVATEGVSAAIRSIEASIRDEHDVPPDATVVLYGEWIGPGIQRGVAINRLPTKQWVLFAVRVIHGEVDRYIDAVPMLGDTLSELQIYSIADGPRLSLTVDFADVASKTEALTRATEATNEIEEMCPWARRFEIAGTGEGIVWCPIGSHAGNSSLFFKTKGDKHKVTKSRDAKPKLDPEVLQGIDAFLEFAVTDIRLTQGLEALAEMGHPIGMRSMGHFLKWVGLDVKRECALELEENDLEWKQVSKAVTQRARAFFSEAVTQVTLR